MPRLRRSDWTGPGYTRRRRGPGFSYRSTDGTALRDPDELERVKALAIPPAWRRVWICPYANGHIQAVGIDDAGRRQYIYHPFWRQRQDARKFEHALDFAARLPAIRAAVTRDLAAPGFTRERAHAAALRIMDIGALRVGSSEYADSNGSYGVTTLQASHVSVKGPLIELDFPGKSGQQWQTVLEDEAVAAFIAGVLEGGSTTALGYLQDGVWHSLDAGALNDYLRRISGGDFTAKDFRTWQATLLAAGSLAKADKALRSEARHARAAKARRAAAGAAVRQRTQGQRRAGGVSETARRRAVAATMREVAEHLGNTPAVARKSYVDPRIVDRFMDGETVPLNSGRVSEAAVRRFLAG
ncbi:DNA topoisomerase IB [Arthrobacter mobilis]|uniref:DNA topoisomerase n=1 Tax=Arthrobacter mobilis TaxID=2724944 RepID=A0A7X6HDF1_9MICC|nr:DNA topoisomerase IB [Arthrobacter mobilis]NKX55106.1 DNA topoisomerase IB [Arthrobacter mobilis]